MVDVPDAGTHTIDTGVVPGTEVELVPGGD